MIECLKLVFFLYFLIKNLIFFMADDTELENCLKAVGG